MKIPFLDRFKKRARSQETEVRTPPTPKPSVPKPEGERLSKTVMPNTSRTVGMQESSQSTSSESSFESPPTPRAISFGPKKKGIPRKDLPPAVALALEPRVERAISLELADVVRQMPEGLTKPLESLDSSRRILLKASELERKMSAGKPSVALGSIYSQAPDIFLRTVSPTDTTEIPLPFDKVLEAFMQMQVRRDQTSDENVPQVETPFLKVTLEDSEKFGVPNEPLKGPAKPAAGAEMADEPAIATAEPQPGATEKFVPIPATAEAIAAAHPEAAGAAKKVIPAPAEPAAKPPLRIPLATQPVGKEKASKPSKAAPERIAFHLPPKGTGAPASERVPASSGPPVSTEVPSTGARARVPFEVPRPDVELPRKPEVAPPPPMGETAPAEDKKISLALKPILQSLPVFELSGDPKEVSTEARVEFPFSLIHSQLATGRVAVPPELFEKALPPDGRRFFTAKNLQMPVQLPLQEVLKNLPPDALRMRDDQEEREIGETIETPFSTTAAEDAKRFNKQPQSLLQPDALSGEEAAETAETAKEEPALNAKNIVAQANALPGVRACSLTFTDGLSLAGELPAEIKAEALCAVAPSLLQRIEAHLTDTQIGELHALTLHCAKSRVTFLKHANICLAALHANGDLSDDVRTQLRGMLVELSRAYPQNEP